MAVTQYKPPLTEAPPRPSPGAAAPQKHAPGCRTLVQGFSVLARFFIDRPVLAWVISIVIVLLGVVALVPPADRPVPGDHAADRPGHRQLPRGQRPGRGRHRGRADRAAGQRRREHAVHVVAVQQRRLVHPDRDLRARHRPEHGPGAGAEPRRHRPAAAARRGQGDRRDRQEAVAGASCWSSTCIPRTTPRRAGRITTSST